ncbi:MAG: hypothetical protein MR407_01370 [Roseburia sp.]|nr:hypothetical protein [Roseburia sp.]
MNKTIKQIADELQIDKQRVYRYIKANHINEALREAHQKNNVKYYDEAAQMQIKKAFAAKITSKRSTSKSTSDLHHEALNEALLDTIEMLKNELKIKNEQIEKMHVLLDQEQKLRLVAEDMIHALEDKEEPKKRFFPFWRKN